MFQEKRLAFFYALSPIHMGSGTSLGVIDNPIQRERHTEYPILAGSGLKGSARELASARVNHDGKIAERDISRIFGPETDASDHAGALSFSDGQLVAFPVRSLRQGFVYAISPIALQRLKRLASTAGISTTQWQVSEPADGEAVVLDERLISAGKLVLENYEYKPLSQKNELQAVAEWLADNALPQDKAHEFFRDKIKRHLVLLSENQFSYFVRNATVVEPHVRINDVTGTAEDGALFFTENVPPESLFVSLVMASQERRKKGSSGKEMKANEIMEKLQEALDNSLIQVGGDATTGRGQMLVRFTSREKEEGNEDA